jgi:hypothetical protein
MKGVPQIGSDRLGREKVFRHLRVSKKNSHSFCPESEQANGTDGHGKRSYSDQATRMR